MTRRLHYALWVIGIVIAVFIALGLVAWFTLRAPAFNRYLARTAAAKASAAVGMPVQLGSLQLHVHGLSPTADLDNVKIGALATIAHLHLGIHITSVVHRTWQLTDIELDHPVVNFDLHSGKGSASPDIFSLAIRRLIVRNGVIHFRDQSIPLSVDISGISLVAAYSQPQYTGTFSFQSGCVQYSNFPAVPTAASLSFRASPTGITISALALTSGASRLTASAAIADFAHPEIRADFRAHLDLALAHNAQIPRGFLDLSGSAAYNGAVTAQAAFSSPALDVPAAGLDLAVRNLSGHVAFADNTVQVTALRAAVLGGSLAASATIASNIQFHAQIRGAQLADLRRFAGSSRATFRQLGITGRLNTDLTARLHPDGSDLALSGSTSLAATVAGVPVQAHAQGRYAANAIHIAHVALTAPDLSATASGTLDHSATLNLHARSSDLRQLAYTASALAIALTGHPLTALGLSGAGTVTATVTGTLAAPDISANLALAPFTVKGTAWRSVQAVVAANSSQLQIRRLSLTGHAAESIQATATIALDHWSFLLTNTVAASISAAAVPVPQLHQSLRFAHATLSGTGQQISAQLAASLPLGSLEAHGTLIPSTRAYTAEFHTSPLILASVPALAAQHIQGDITASGSGSGTVAHPAATVTLTSPGISAAGQTIGAIVVHAQLADHRLQASLAATALDSPLRATAAVALTGAWPANASLVAPAVPLKPLLAAFAPAAADQISGRMAAQATLAGPLRDLDALQIQVTVPSLTVAAGPMQFIAAAPIHVALANGIATLAPAHITGPSTNLTASGSIPLRGTATMNLALNGSVDLRLLQTFAPNLTTAGQLAIAVNATGAPSNPQLAGQLTLSNLAVTSPDFPVGLSDGDGLIQLHTLEPAGAMGSPARSSVTGSRGVAARGPAPINARLDIATFTGMVGGGKLDLSGGVALANGVPQFSLALRAEQIHLRTPPTLRETLNANLTFAGTPAAAQLGGRVEVDDVSPTPQFDFANFVSQLSSSATIVSPPGSFTQDLTLALTVTTPNRIHIASPALSLQANANVTVRGTAAEPVVLGRVDLASGDLIFRGNRYVIETGTLDFINPAQTEPTVNLTADTTIQQYDLHLHFQGPADTLHTTYTSNPPLPPADIINLLAFGQTTEASAANPTPGNLGAENLVAGAVTSQITDRVQRVAGISQLSVDPILGGTGQQGAGARITVQQRVTGNLFVTFSTDTTGTERDIVEVQYQLSPRVSLTGVRDQNGGFTLSTRIKKVW